MPSIKDWIVWKVQHLRTDIRYEAAMWNREKAISNLEQACTEKFRAIQAIEEQIISEEMVLSEALQVVNGAMVSFIEDKKHRHREVGEQSLEQLARSRARVEELKASQERHRTELVTLKEDHQSEERTLHDLTLDKPRAMAELDSAWAEISAYDRASRPAVTDRAARTTNGYKLKATARRDAYRFIKEDVYEAYRPKEPPLIWMGIPWRLHSIRW